MTNLTNFTFVVSILFGLGVIIYNTGQYRAKQQARAEVLTLCHLNYQQKESKAHPLRAAVRVEVEQASQQCIQAKE